MSGEQLRISNMSKNDLQELWKRYSPEEINELILGCNQKEISTLFGFMSERGVQVILDSLSKDSAIKVFTSLRSANLKKTLLLASSGFLDRISRLLPEDLFCDVLSNVGPELRNRIMKALPIKEKAHLNEIIENKLNFSSHIRQAMSEDFGGSLERETIGRLKELEERERFLERRQRAREEQLLEQFESLRGQIVQAEKELNSRQSKMKSLEASYSKKENELKENIRQLQEEHQRQVQEKIEIKVPEFVASAINSLEGKEKEFAKKATTWNYQGHGAIGLAITASIVAFWYGAYAFSTAVKTNIDWFFFCFLIIKGLVIISLFAAWAKHAYTIANAYMHESLKRADRMHAINFGKLYLEVYGNDVSQADMKAVFENWNLDSDSAFTKIRPTNLEPKTLSQVSQIITAVSNAAKTKE
ncbi:MULTISPECIES: hypothetical protein [unclassified Pseudomonas]|uniref:hypothetical protein n=1 Tax=unclassified Pseudomonas TaxID=196821 RepID=UPI000D990DC5|nr:MULTISPECIES: hypothetical protein [unclassified Pseudomonas]PYG82206.1 hypothetical protein N428_01159 [Pseudomonas sp. RV120224-01c]PYG85564.1 hypothetical protein N436_01158 [Pseudomonas sp. RV120224-01b]